MKPVLGHLSPPVTGDLRAELALAVFALKPSRSPRVRLLWKSNYRLGSGVRRRPWFTVPTSVD